MSKLEIGEGTTIPLYLCRVSAGFPSPADGYVESNIYLNDWLTRNKLATYIVRVEGDSMTGEIHSDDRLIVGRSLEPRHGDVVIACIDGEMLVKCLAVEEGCHYLVAENPPNFIYSSPETATLLKNAQRLAESDGTVPITGETGTGKEILARMIHHWSGPGGAFIPVNCGALTETRAESQIFRHLKGSFTDAVTEHAGVVRQAAGGTLFLDEVAELSVSNQGKPLRLIERGEIHCIGAPVPEHLDVRIIAATNRDLQFQIKSKKFREDLFYRLQMFHLVITPLRERPEEENPNIRRYKSSIVVRRVKTGTITPLSSEQA